MRFSREFLNEEEGETIEDKFLSRSRWHLRYRRVFMWEGKYYAYIYDQGATEYQEDEDDDPNDMVECPEVFPAEKTITVYEERG